MRQREIDERFPSQHAWITSGPHHGGEQLYPLLVRQIVPFDHATQRVHRLTAVGVNFGLHFFHES